MADVAVFLASNEGRAITGTTIKLSVRESAVLPA